MTVVLVTALGVLCLKELYEGYSQLFMSLGKKNGQDICVGSFSNSGLYGCFLAVCASTFAACCVRLKTNNIKNVLIALIVFSLLLLPVTMSRASFLALSVSVFFLILNGKRVKLLVRRNWVVVSVLIVLLGTGAYVIKKPSADGRMLMDRIGLRIIMKKGFKGAGAGLYAGAYGEEQRAFFMEMVGNNADEMKINGIPESIRKIADCPCYAFNEYLNAGVEYGPIAMLLMLVLIAFCIVSAYKSGSCWCYSLLTLTVFALFSYPFHTKFYCYLFTALVASIGKTENRKVLFVAVYSLIAIIACFYLKTEEGKIDNSLAHSYHNKGGIFFESQPNVLLSKNLLTGMYNMVDQNTLFYSGLVYNKNGSYNKSDSILKIGTLISSDPMFWNVMGNNSLALGKYREAEERYKHAFYMVPNRLYPLYLLAKLYHTEGDSARFLKMADLIETFEPKIESIKTERLRSEIREIKTTYHK